MALDPEGFMYIGGAFSRVNDQPRTRLAKLSMSGSGSVDTDWVAAADDAVYAIDIDSTGAVYAGGYFTAINGQERLRVAKLSGVDGTLDPLWNPAANSYVMALAVDGDSIFVGGYFTSTIQSPSIGGQDREGIAKLSLTGTGAADPDWSSTMRDVNTITLGPNGTLFAGGSGMRSRLKISTTGFGAIDEAWMASVPGSTTDRIRAIAYDGRESVYLGGLFVLPDNTLPRRLARVAAGGAGTVDDQWNPMPNSDGIEGFNAAAGYYVLAVDPRGTLFVGGLFTTIGGLPRVALAAFPEAVFADGFETPE